MLNLRSVLKTFKSSFYSNNGQFVLLYFQCCIYMYILVDQGTIKQVETQPSFGPNKNNFTEALNDYHSKY